MRSSKEVTRISLAVWVLWGCHAHAAEDLRLEPVVVTGSNLPQADVDRMLPVRVIDRREIERTGARTAAEVIGQLGANQTFQNEAMSVGSYGPAAYSGANLRGLGESNTLVLVNGRRVAQHAGTFGAFGAAGPSGGSSDLNAIPLSAIERIEVLKDGASAIYGADAVGGVINFILRRDASPLTLSGDLANATHQGAASKSLSLTGGGGDAQSGLGWFGAVSWQTEQRLAARQRRVSRSSYVPGLVNYLGYGTWPAGVSYYDAGVDGWLFANPNYPTCRPPGTVADPDGSGVCLYDYSDAEDLQPAVDRLNASLSFSGRIDASLNWHAEWLGSRIVQSTHATPTYVSRLDPSTGESLYPFIGTGSPFYPTAWAAANGNPGDLMLDWRLVDQGPRGDRHVGQQQRWLVGIVGEQQGWSYDTAVSLNRHRLVSTMTRGYWRYADLEGLVSDGTLNPFGEQTAAGQARLDALSLRDSYATLKTGALTLDFKARRTLFERFGKPVALALGGEVRRESLTMLYSQDAIDCAIAAGSCGGYDLDRSRSVAAVFGELGWPLSPTLDAQVAVRHDRYGVGGSSTTPKLALKWRASPMVLWRGSAGRGFIAPSLEQLYAPNAFSVAAGGPYDDSERCGATGSVRDCGFQFSTQYGGNAQLKPETSRQFNLGVVLGGTARWTATLDWWSIDKRDKIGYVPAGSVFANLPAYESLGLVHRYQPGDTLPAGTSCVAGPNGPVCPIQYIDSVYRNLGRQQTSGVDVGYQWRQPLKGAGVWSIKADGTWVQRFRTQVSAASAFVDQLGRYELNQPVPRWRQQVQLTWERAAWEWTLANRYTSSYVDYNPDPAQLPQRRVSAWSVFDAQVGWRSAESFALRIGIRNLFDREPPASRQSNSFQVGYDPHFADPRGRMVYVRGDLQF